MNSLKYLLKVRTRCKKCNAVSEELPLHCCRFDEISVNSGKSLYIDCESFQTNVTSTPIHQKHSVHIRSLSCSTNSSFLEDEFYDCQSNVIIPCDIRNQEETSSLVRRITSDSGNESGGVDLDGECSATFGLQVDPRNIEPCRIQTRARSEKTTQREVVYIPFR